VLKGLRRTVRRCALAAPLVIWLAGNGIDARAQDAAPATAPQAWTFLNGLAAQPRMQVLTREAAREGTLTLYGAIAIERAQILIDLFHKSYPKIDVQFVRLTTTDLPQRMLIEQRANRTNADVGIVTSDRLDIMSSAIAPYQPTSWPDFDPRFLNGAASKGWAAVNYEVMMEAIAWRTDRIPSAQAPRTLDQVADPKWKGRTGTVTSLEHLVDSYDTLYGKQVAAEKIDKLAALDNHLYPAIAGLSEGLGSGQIDLAWGVSAMRAIRLQKAGAPIDYVYEEPAFGVPDAVFVAKQAKHPYAAALFMEFLTSANTLEAVDKGEPGLVFGNTKGTYSKPISGLKGLTIFGPIPESTYRDENRLVQSQFIRRN
jgi:iron(III) transport system substrate-binding protein